MFKKKIVLLIILVINYSVNATNYLYVLDNKHQSAITIENFENKNTNETLEKNAEWSTYLNNKNCWNDPLEIIEKSSLICLSKLINSSDSDFSNGNIGISEFTNFNFSNNNLSHIDFLSSVDKFIGGFDLNNNLTLSNINGISNVSRFLGDVDLRNTDISDYSALSNINIISGELFLDSLVGGEIFPTEGTWCDNDIYYKSNDALIREEASNQCGNEYIEENNAGWASYLYSKNSGNNKCSERSTYIANNASFYRCSNVAINPSDINYPYGNIGITSAREIRFESNQITNIDMFTGLNSVANELYLRFNPSLTNLDGFSSLKSVGTNFFLQSNPNFSDISGLSSLISVGVSLYMTDTNITDYSPLSNLGSVGGTIYIDALEGDETFPTSGAWCDNKTYLNFVNNNAVEVATIACGYPTDTTVDNNSGWASYLYSKNSGNNKCTERSTDIANNASFYRCSNVAINPSDINYPYGNIGITSAREIRFESNQITNIDMFTGLNSVANELYLRFNPSLTNLDGFSSLKSVGTNFFLQSNPNFSDISGLSSLISVGVSLYMTDTNITDYSPLSNLGSVGGTIYIDSLKGDEIFPSSGAWCDNSVYNKISNAAALALAEDFCNI